MLYSLEFLLGNKDMLPLFIQIFSINYKQEPIYRHIGFPLHQWFYTKQGKAEAIIGDRYYEIHEGECLFIPSGIAHRYSAVDGDWIVDSVVLSGKASFDYLRCMGCAEPGVYAVKNPDLFPRYTRNLYRLYKDNPPGCDFAFSKEAYHFLMDFSACSEYLVGNLQKQPNKNIIAITHFIEKNYDRPFTLQEMADSIHLTKEYMCSLFMQEMDQTIIHFANGIRINHARILLTTHTEKKVSEIAHMCGFKSPAYFDTVFHKEMGVTPVQFRLGLQKGIKH